MTLADLMGQLADHQINWSRSKLMAIPKKSGTLAHAAGYYQGLQWAIDTINDAIEKESRNAAGIEDDDDGHD